MKIKEFWNWKELRSISIASIILGFIISFTEWGPGQTVYFSIGLANWFRGFLLAFIIFLIYIIANKQIAKLHGATAQFKIWGIERFWFNKSAKVSNIKFFGKKIGNSFKTGIFLPLLFSLFSNGLIKFAAIGYTEVSEISAQRTGKKFKHLNDFEIARIHLAGPLICLLIAIIFSTLDSFNKLAYVAKLITIYSILPISKLDGAKILFGSFPLYIFTLFLIIGSLLLINIIPTIASFFLALLLSIIILLIYLYRTN